MFSTQIHSCQLLSAAAREMISPTRCYPAQETTAHLIVAGAGIGLIILLLLVLCIYSCGYHAALSGPLLNWRSVCLPVKNSLIPHAFFFPNVSHSVPFNSPG